MILISLATALLTFLIAMFPANLVGDEAESESQNHDLLIDELRKASAISGSENRLFAYDQAVDSAILRRAPGSSYYEGLHSCHGMVRASSTQQSLLCTDIVGNQQTPCEYRTLGQVPVRHL